MKIAQLLVLLGVFLASCTEPEKRPEANNKYVDLKGFFHDEASRLQNSEITVNKTVSRNGVSESREGVLPDWAVELDLFKESDINKPAWSDSYLIKQTGSDIQYTALDSKLRTREVSLKQDKLGKIVKVSIINKTSNYLYNSSEELTYIPDSVYKIIKKQDVILLGNNHYEVSGFFR